MMAVFVSSMYFCAICGSDRADPPHVPVEVVRGEAVEVDELQLPDDAGAIGVPQHERPEHVVPGGVQLGLARGLGLETIDLVEDLLERGAGHRGGDIRVLGPGGVAIAVRHLGVGRVGVALALPQVRGHPRGEVAPEHVVRDRERDRVRVRRIDGGQADDERGLHRARLVHDVDRAIRAGLRRGGMRHRSLLPTQKRGADGRLYRGRVETAGHV
jgi:hypothetical protein